MINCFFDINRSQLYGHLCYRVPIRTFQDVRGCHFIHSALKPRVDAMLSDDALTKSAQWNQLEVKLIFTVKVLLLSSFTFFSICQMVWSSIPVSTCRIGRLYTCLEKLPAFLNNLPDARKGEAFLTSFMRTLPITMCARGMTDKPCIAIACIQGCGVHKDAFVENLHCFCHNSKSCLRAIQIDKSWLRC